MLRPRTAAVPVARLGDGAGGVQPPRDAVTANPTAAGCAVGPLESIDSVFENPQIAARGSLARLPDPDLGEVVVNNAFPRFAKAGAPPLEPGRSSVGADTAAVLGRDLGLGEDELRRLHASGAIAEPRYRDSGGSGP